MSGKTLTQRIPAFLINHQVWEYRGAARKNRTFPQYLTMAIEFYNNGDVAAQYA
jgi:pyocin large subunit-like protein